MRHESKIIRRIKTNCLVPRNEFDALNSSIYAKPIVSDIPYFLHSFTTYPLLPVEDEIDAVVTGKKFEKAGDNRQIGAQNIRLRERIIRFSEYSFVVTP